MRTTNPIAILTFAFLTLTSALPALVKEDAQCNEPTTFTITSFTTQMPDTTANGAPQSISFEVMIDHSDSGISQTSCTHTGQGRDITTTSPLISCENGKNSFEWDGRTLIMEADSCTPLVKRYGDLDLIVLLKCNPNLSGSGSTCKVTGQMTGSFTRNTKTIPKPGGN